MSDVLHKEYLYEFDYLDFVIIDKALNLYYKECSVFSKDNVKNTMLKVEEIILRSE